MAIPRNVRIKSLLTQFPNTWTWMDRSDALSSFADFIGILYMPDRFGYLNQFSRWNFCGNDEPFPTRSCTDTLESLLLRRAEEIVLLSRKTGRHINVEWSGGVDSTAVLLALLTVLDSDARLHVLYTNSSIAEYEKFYHYLCRHPKVEMHRIIINFGHNDVEAVRNGGYVVTGFPADQLFGSIVDNIFGTRHDADWHCIIHSRKAIEQFEAAFQHYDLPIRNQSQFTWFMNFSTKWIRARHMFQASFGHTIGGIINFFSPEYFQAWSVSNFDRLHVYNKVEPKNYKRDLKLFIHKYFRDEEYLNTKGKEGSVGLAMSEYFEPECKPFVLVVDTDDNEHLLKYDRPVPGSEFWTYTRKLTLRVLPRLYDREV